jgi:hypothetical protein
MANDVFLERRQILMAAVETTEAVDAAPQHTNSYQAIKMMEPFNVNLAQEFVEQTAGLLTRGMSRPIGTVRPMGITFKTYVCGLDSGSYTANRKPPIGDLLRACGMYETFISSDASGKPVYQYAPAADVGSDASITVVAHKDGYEHRFVGARGNVNLVYGAAAPVIAEFTLRGQLTTEASTTRTGNPVLWSQIPPRWVASGTIYVGSFQALPENLNFNSNNTLLEQRAPWASSGSGIIKVIITERQPGGSFDPEAMQPGSLDAIGNWRSSSGMTIRLQAGVSQGNRFTLTASQAIIKQVGWGNKTGLSIFNIDYQAYETSGNDEYMIQFD